MFSLKPNKADSTAPKRGRLPFAIAFKPDIRASARPIGESTRLFVKLIGMLFAMNGLFPKDHPALVPNSEMPLSLHEVISTGWNSFSMTEKDAPKALFFFAAVGCMVITTLAVVVGLFSLFVGTAHAQSKFFTPPANDMAQQWIDYLFNGVPLNNYYDQAGSDVANVTQTGNLNIQCSMIIALGFYSDAVLLVAALILFYHLAWMVVETAHHGQVMGKRGNQIWAPIRLVVAVGLLVPISNNPPKNCPAATGAGLNSAQYITIKIAELGSALASNVWITFVNALQAAPNGFVPPSTPDVENTVKAIFEMEGCAAAWNWHEQTLLTPPGSPNWMNVPQDTGDFDDPVYGTEYNYGTQVNDEQDICGDILVPNPPTTSTTDKGALDSQVPIQTAVYQAIYQAHKQALQDAVDDIRDRVAGDITYQVPDWNEAVNGGAQAPVNDDLRAAVNAYYTGLNAALAAAYAGMQDSLKNEAFTTAGWIAAGTWMNTISRDQANIANAVYDGAPEVEFPTVETVHTDVANDTSRDLKHFTDWLTKGFTPSTNNPPPTIAPCNLQQGAIGANAGDRQWGQNESSPFSMFMWMLDELAMNYGLWTPDENYTCPGTNAPPFSIGTQFKTTNPFGELTALGHDSIRLAIQLTNMMLYAMAGSAALDFLNGLLGPKADQLQDTDPSKGFKSGLEGLLGMFKGLAALIIPLFSIFAIIFFTIGVTLGFILPLIPFMHFFFAAIAWGLVLLEAIIAMPLVALAHLNPEGDGLPGNMARQAYFMLLGLFMRPTMIIFAFIASLLIFFLSMFLLNKLFAATVVGTLGTGQGYYTLTRIVYMIIYVFLAYTCAVNCFRIIDSLPESVFRWINISLGHQKLGDAGSTLQSAGGIVTAAVTQQGMGTLGKAGEGLSALGASAGQAGAGIAGMLSKK